MPKQVEECVRKIKGTNKRTGKPYTQAEKWAICQAMNKKSKEASFEEDVVIPDEEIAEAVEHGMAECMRKMMDTGKAHDRDEARSMCEGMLANSNFVVEHLKLYFNQKL